MKIWICELNNNNGGCYNLLHQTKKDLLKDITEIQKQEEPYKDDFERYEAFQVEVNTSNAFELIRHCTSEGGGRYAYSLGDIIQEYKVTSANGKFGLKQL